MNERRLILMRHAKSSWDEFGLSDHDRPLNGRGRASAPVMADALAARGWVPDRAAVSSAARTRETWALMRDGLGDVPSDVTSSLYMGSVRDIRALAAEWDPAWRTVLVLGHNPGWSDAASLLTGRNVALTTANCALLIGEGATWAQAMIGPWEMEALLRPRDLMQD
jgi:phosphohistidine phosphatase